MMAVVLVMANGVNLLLTIGMNLVVMAAVRVLAIQVLANGVTFLLGSGGNSNVMAMAQVLANGANLVLGV